MSDIERFEKEQIDKFKRLYHGRQGGIFTQKTRDRILTKKGISGRGRAKNQFWYRQRENVKTALIDILLFIELSDKKDVDQVLTKESLEPIIRALLFGGAVFNKTSDKNRAKIADILIRQGFRYLEGKAGSHITKSHDRTITEALDLSNYLVGAIEGMPLEVRRVPPLFE